MIGVSDDCMDAGGRATQEPLPSAANTPTSPMETGIAAIRFFQSKKRRDPVNLSLVRGYGNEEKRQ
ncbi:hypothetical protein ACH42_14640 [Endozoicomonas sp. (ex Bugula neritina AB1)]|nr:hypothetical protein ACH42_14640 [Endozoicomonas sp. (ex Bugula neritina AB1)]